MRQPSRSIQSTSIGEEVVVGVIADIAGIDLTPVTETETEIETVTEIEKNDAAKIVAAHHQGLEGIAAANHHGE